MSLNSLEGQKRLHSKNSPDHSRQFVPQHFLPDAPIPKYVDRHVHTLDDLKMILKVIVGRKRWHQRTPQIIISNFAPSHFFHQMHGFRDIYHVLSHNK